MGKSFRWVQARETALTAGPVTLVVLAVLAAFWITAQFIGPAPPRELVIAAASRHSPYWAAAERYREILAESGVTLTIRETKGSMENLALISDPAARIDAAFIQGGLTGGQPVPGVSSLGRVFQEPVWIFYQGPQQLQKLSELAGKRVLIGPAGSATAALATRLLNASGITAQTATLINAELPDTVEALDTGAADAGFLVLAPEARTVKRLFDSPKAQLMNVVQAGAYTQRFPFLKSVELREGVVDFARDLPPADTRMLTTTAALVVRDRVHPALVSLLTQAAIEVHRQPRLNAQGEASAFARANAFPLSEDQEFPLAAEAQRVYKSGEPFFQRFLPFWLATLADRLMVMLLPLLGVLLPVLKFAPALYAWRIRQRIVYWYRELRKIEADIGDEPDQTGTAEALSEIERIERAVNLIPVPLAFANQLYDLRGHIDVVRHRLEALRRTADTRAGTA
ncbi:MAG: TAXI family TRAP transporter solute-binding subunit [Rhodospirillaceae bacterium]